MILSEGGKFRINFPIKLRMKLRIGPNFLHYLVFKRSQPSNREAQKTNQKQILIK